MTTPRRLEPGDPDYDPFLDDVERGAARGLYFDRQGQPISLRQYAQLMEIRWSHRLRYDLIGEFEISTIWLGVALRRDEQDRPLIFETATNVLRAGFEPVNLYATEEDALAGHESWVVLARGMTQQGLSNADALGELPKTQE